jgi:hypothetical protein
VGGRRVPPGDAREPQARHQIHQEAVRRELLRVISELNYIVLYGRAHTWILVVQVMLDTFGPELQVVNASETPISLEENGTVVLTPHQGQEATNSLLPINFAGLAKVTHGVC